VAGVTVRRAVRLTGIVQGVGMRPYLHRRAVDHGLAGLVGNDAAGVFVEVEGPAGQVEAFLARLVPEAPALAVVEDFRVQPLPVIGEQGFRIVASQPGEDAGSQPVALVPPDTATCQECLAEMLDPADRRYRYPFIACTYCGPRFTIVRGVPYDRPSTTMDAFPLCPACAREYDDPHDRRFHAQPTACPACGPRLALRRDGEDVPTLIGDEALAAAMRLLAEGAVVAIKGVGGYHLACDARNPQAVARLRARKRRSAKPFALLAADLAVVRSLVHADDDVERALASAAGPIVLAPARLHDPAVRAVRDAVAPAQSHLGVMLASNGLHHLLVRPHPDLAAPPVRLLVLTSANLSDEPICTDPDEADERLAGIADAWLHHDRPIHLACDDSVVRVHAQGVLAPVRRSRGYAPVPVRLPVDCPPTLAVGGELKATVCLADGRRGWLSQHLGDVASLEALALLERTVAVLGEQSRVSPERVVADQHPGYLSARWAREQAALRGVELVRVQHHHAHLGSLLAEHAWPPDAPVLGVAFDGTGYGTDGAIWGGEVLLGSYQQVRRVAHLRAVPLPGGDAAITHPARIALAHLDAAGLPWDERLPAVAAVPPAQRRLLAGMLRSGAGCVPTTSMGRLFDAVASLAGVCQQAGYEGQPAMELEALLEALGPDPGPASVGARYAFAVEEQRDGTLVLDPAPVLAGVVRDVLAGTPSAAVSAGLHAAVAAAVLAVARHVRHTDAVQTVGLTGGVFQNAAMTSGCLRSLGEDGFEVLLHRRVPPNDGGLALGQAIVAACGGGR
jgi:hydrogenase maturation protein HypF